MTMTKRKSRFLQLSMLCFMVIFAMPSWGFTNEQDVAAINDLYVALGSPVLPGWIPNGGDPCLENWQGVTCVGSNITGITINSANLGGELGNGLGKFTAINVIDFSNNNIGGSIPESLPPTLNSLFLSANQFTGSIPISLSKLSFLSAMSLNVNQLSGELPDAFQPLTDLVNLDLSSNNFSGKLPPSMEGLSSLTTMHVQNNRLSGTLDVLQDLPIKDLNIENNLFSGPIPEKLLSIPTFKKDGNPLINSTEIAPSSEPLVPPPELSPPLPFRRVPPPPRFTPSNSSNSSNSSASSSSNSPNIAEGPSSQISHTVKKSGTSTIKIIGFVIIGAISLIVIVLVIIFCVSKFQERKERRQETSNRHRQEIIPHVRPKEPRSHENFNRSNASDKRVRNASEDRNQVAIDMNGTGTQMRNTEKKKEHVLNRAVSEDFMIPPPPPPPPPHPAPASPPIIPIPFPVEKVTVKPIIASETSRNTPPPITPDTLTSVASYSVAQLQQYTNSFSEDNLIKDGRLGKVFLAELPDGKLLTVLKLDNVNSRMSVDEFLHLVLSISELRHPNIVELVGYSADYGQTLLVYNYFSKKTLHDILYYEEDFKKKLSWSARLQVVLGAAKALEYLHEGCQPPIVHQEFEPSNILAELELNYGRRYGLLGLNGCGKSTLLTAIGLRELPIPDHMDIFHLTREIEASDMTALEAVFNCDEERIKLEKEAEILGAEDGGGGEALERIYERLEALDAATAEKRAAEILFGLGFDKQMQAKKTRDFSGGWRMRIALARALFMNPTILLLDEPTNHLDLEACVWLEEMLKKFDRILVVISHSQDFLNGVCTNIIHMQNKKLKMYTGNYDQYVQTRAELEENQMKQYRWEQEQIANMKEYIARFGHGSAKLARQAQSKEKTLAKMERGGLTEKVSRDKVLVFRFTDVGKLPPPVLQFIEVSFGYTPDSLIYKNIEFGVDLDSRIALVGPNGAGKSTLLKLMTGDLQPSDGMVKRHNHLKIAQYHQHLAETLDMDMSALQYMMKEYPGNEEDKMRSAIGRFGLTGKAQVMPMKNLSDGQRSRVIFAWLAWRVPNMLLLDEPTNHLDIETIDSLAEALNEWDGGLVLVSHDFRLISQVAKEIWVCENKAVSKWNGDIMGFKAHLKKKSGISD